MRLASRFVWYELMTTDMAVAQAFYCDVVGWGIRDASSPGSPYTLFTVGADSVSGLMELTDEAQQMGAAPSWIGYLGVDEVDRWAERVKALGGSVPVAPREIPGVSRFAVAADPQFAGFGLMRWFPPGKDGPLTPDRPGHVGWSELIADDPDEALGFYSELCGWERAERSRWALRERTTCSAPEERLSAPCSCGPASSRRRSGSSTSPSPISRPRRGGSKRGAGRP